MNLILAYKNFAANRNISHIGLGVSAINTCKVLQANGVRAIVKRLAGEKDYLNLDCTQITHVVVSAPWIQTALHSEMCERYPDTQFAINCHSNVGFLQADPRGIHLLREGLELEQGTHNFHVAGNSRRLCAWLVEAYGHPAAYLPNLYYLDHTTQPHRPGWNHNGGTLRIGVFGATRPLKNFITAIGAAIQISRELKAETEIWVSTNRDDGHGGNTVLEAGKQLVANLPHCKLVPAPWGPWPQFRKLVGSMHLLLQPSYTESFNMVTADGVAEGVPSVVSSAITWAPHYWKADVDDVADVAAKGIHILHHHRAGFDGLAALEHHNADGLRAWMEYLRR